MIRLRFIKRRPCLRVVFSLIASLQVAAWLHGMSVCDSVVIQLPWHGSIVLLSSKGLFAAVYWNRNLYSEPIFYFQREAKRLDWAVDFFFTDHPYTTGHVEHRLPTWTYDLPSIRLQKDGLQCVDCRCETDCWSLLCADWLPVTFTLVAFAILETWIYFHPDKRGRGFDLTNHP